MIDSSSSGSFVESERYNYGRHLNDDDNDGLDGLYIGNYISDLLRDS